MCVYVCIYRQHLLPTHKHTYGSLHVYIQRSLALSVTHFLSGCLLLYVSLSLSLASSPGGNARAMPGLCPILVGTLALMMIETTNVSPQPQPQPQLPDSATVGAAATPRKTKDARCEMRVACSARQIPDFDFKFVSRGGFKGRLGKWPAARLPVGHVSPGTWYSIFLFVCLGPFWH